MGMMKKRRHGNMAEISDGIICIVKRLDGYKVLPSCLIGYVDGATPNRD